MSETICVKYIANDQHIVASHVKFMVWHQDDKLSFIFWMGSLYTMTSCVESRVRFGNQSIIITNVDFISKNGANCIWSSGIQQASLDLWPNYSKTKFPSNLNFERNIACGMNPQTLKGPC